MAKPHVLILGGIGEAKQIASVLISKGVVLTYSVAGLVRRPELNCTIRVGGFSSKNKPGLDGLIEFLEKENISLLINATHPYAGNMSANAAVAAKRLGIPCWRYLRPGWSSEQIANAKVASSIEQLLTLCQHHLRPFFTIGQGVLDYIDNRTENQHWVVRTAVSAEHIPGVTIIDTIGPFDVDNEIELMRTCRVDALVAKNSGGTAVAGKLKAARVLGIPVYLLERPGVDLNGQQVFESADALLEVFEEFVS